MKHVEILAGEDGEISVHDHIERRRYGLVTDGPVALRGVDTEEFVYPVDTAVAFEGKRISLPYDAYTAVRNSDGETLVWLQILDEHEFESGTYFVEIDGAIKLYLRVEGPVTVSAEPKERVIELENAGEILVGARSYHERPATTITTTADPVDLMRAISHLSSALKTTTPDRSYPSLRGHPPELELGDRFEVPAAVTTLDTGVRIEVPPSVEYIFPVASLAYYLGAEVVPGIEPRVVADGFDYPLESPGTGFERSVERALKRTLFLDCVTRSESSQSPSLHEGRVLSDEVSVPFGELFEASPGERLSAYFDVPYESIEPHLPRWKLTAHVKPAAVHASVLPFLVDDLAVIRTPDTTATAASDVDGAAVDSFMRSDGGIRVRAGSRNEGTSRPVVEPGETDSIEQAWVGEETPIGASKAMVEAYRNRVTREPREGDIDVVLVCNDDEMNDELDSVEGTYGSREEVPFDVTTYRYLTPDRLALVLESDIDFLHYVGHIDQNGFECKGGTLDAANVSDVGVDSFFLNACSSYDQGVELIRRGAIGGAVTLNDVINTGALRVGRTMAGLLNCGFPLRPALDIARDQSIVGSQYIVVGDGNVDIAHAEGFVPELFDLWDHEDDGMWNVDVTTYPTGHASVGSIYKPEVDSRDRCFLVGSRDMSFEVPSERLRQTSGMTVMPVRVNGRLMWTDQVDYDA